MIERLVLLGATGDLAGRFLFPALASLADAGELPDDFEVIGAAQSSMDDAEFREMISQRLERHAGETSAGARDKVLTCLGYRSVDVANAESVAGLLDTAGNPSAIYLALPPSVFPMAVSALAGAEFPSGSRLALEKPFGENLESAVALNAQLAASFGDNQVFRVDHVLGMATTENLIAMRSANHVFEPLWNSEHIAEVEVLWEETLALEGRAGYYDDAGALRDVMQNHLMQLLALVAMEPGDGPRRVRKADALRAVRPIDPARSRRARYTAGRLGSDDDGEGREVPSYVDEEGVDEGKKTETYGEIEIAVDTARWEGTRFVMRAGKALARRRKAVVVRFRSSGSELDELRIGIDGPTETSLHLRSVELASESMPGGLPTYGRILQELLTGGSEGAVGAEEAEIAWEIVGPVVEAWGSDRVPLEEYPAGSRGP